MKRDLTKQRKLPSFAVGGRASKKQNESLHRSSKKAQELEVPLQAGVSAGTEDYLNFSKEYSEP